MPEVLDGGRPRPMVRDDERKLLRMLGMFEESPLPDAVVDAYWKAKRLFDLLGYSAVSDELLVFVVLFAGAGPPTPQKLPWAVQAFQDGALKANDQVSVRIGTATKPARFLRVCQDQVRARVHVVGDGDERLVPIGDVLGPVEAKK